MKVIALIPAKNEETLLPICLNSLKEFIDEVVIYDDHSTDKTVEVARGLGAHIITENFASSSGWPEFEIRERLLEEGRARGGTHFISLDADEAITPSFAQKAKEYFISMKPGDSLSLRWITLWKSTHCERIDGVFNNLYKDFAFCDDRISHHQYAFLGVGRIPSSSGRRIKIPYHLGGILHFQYVLWNKAQLKQAWYRCAELLHKTRSARRINSTYTSTLDGKHVNIKELPNSWKIPFSPKEPSIWDYWQYQKITGLFHEYGIEKFETLQIWHIDELRSQFVQELKREPRPSITPRWILKINDIKNVVKNWYYANFS